MPAVAPLNPPPKNHPKALLYWKINIWILTVLLSVWFVVSFPVSIIWAEALNQFRIGGFPFGFWMAQQGSIIVFVFLVLIYAVVLRWLDRHFDVHEHDR